MGTRERDHPEVERQKAVDAARTRKLLRYFHAIVINRNIEVSPDRVLEGRVFSAAISRGKHTGELDFDWTEENITPSVNLDETGERKVVRITLNKNTLEELESSAKAFVPGGRLPEIEDKTECVAPALMKAAQMGAKTKVWNSLISVMAEAYKLYVEIESVTKPANYSEISPRILLANIRLALKYDARSAVDRIIPKLPIEKQTEFILPEDPPHIGLTVSSKDGALYRIHYFAKPTRYPIGGIYEVHSQNEIIIEKCEPQDQIEAISPEWEALNLTNTSALRRKGTTFLPIKMAVFRGNQFISGDASLLPCAAEALDDAFQNHQTQLLSHVFEILRNTNAEPKKPIRRQGGQFPTQNGGRKLAEITVPIKDKPRIKRR